MGRKNNVKILENAKSLLWRLSTARLEENYSGPMTDNDTDLRQLKNECIMFLNDLEAGFNRSQHNRWAGYIGRKTLDKRLLEWRSDLAKKIDEIIKESGGKIVTPEALMVEMNRRGILSYQGKPWKINNLKHTLNKINYDEVTGRI